MLKERYKRLNEGIHAEEEPIERTLDAAACPKKNTAPISAAGRRLILGFVCTLVVLVLLTPRLMHPHQDILTSNGELQEDTGGLLPLSSAAITRLSSPAVQELLSAHTPDLSASFIPVGLYSEHDGLTFEIVAVCLNDGKPIILAALTGQGVDQNTSFSFEFNREDIHKFNWLTKFDSSFSTLYSLITIEECTPMSSGDQLTVSLFDISLNKPYEYVTHWELDLSAASTAPATQTVQAIRTDYPADWQKGHVSSTATEAVVLVPGEPLLTFPHGSAISATGIINGDLHIQTCRPAFTRTFERNGNTVYSGDGSHLALSVMPRTADEYSVSYLGLMKSHISWTDPDNWTEPGPQYTYIEYVLRIDTDELANYVLRSTYRAPAVFLDSEWTFSFALPHSDQSNLTAE